MVKCLYCGEEVTSEGTKPKKYCSDRCRMKYKRVELQTNRSNKRTEQTNKVEGGKCWCCGKSIHPKLVCCQECTWSGKVEAKRVGVYPPTLTDRTPKEMERDLQTPRVTGGYEMTVMEQLFYRPIDQLMPDQHNFVSKSGMACYGVYE